MSRFPEVLESRRLVLRVPRAGDAEALNRAISDSHAELAEWLPWAAEGQTLAQTRAFCEESLEKWRDETAYNVLMLERETGTLAGASGFPRMNWAVPKFEIGYWCRSDRVGNGYVSEAVWALSRLAFVELGAARVELFVDTRNVRSVRVAERLGFALEGVLRNEDRDPHGALRDTRVYAATRLKDLTSPLERNPPVR